MVNFQNIWRKLDIFINSSAFCSISLQFLTEFEWNFYGNLSEIEWKSNGN